MDRNEVVVRRSSWQDHVVRGVAIGVAVSLHLLALLLIARPDMHWRYAEAHRTDTQRLQLRFLVPQVVTFSRTIAPVHQTHPAVTTRSHSKPTKALPKPMPSTQVSAATPQSTEADRFNTPSFKSNDAEVNGDGGFHARLLQAQGPSATRDIPGSDAPHVPGIRLIDPDTQGIRALARNAQRLFGITSRHCIDVEVLRHLSPQELSARHMSSGDLDRLDAEYQCAKPMGLAF